MDVLSSRTYRDICLVHRKLSDVDEDNALSEDEFCIAMKLVVARRKGITIPATLPDVLRLNSSAGTVCTYIHMYVCVCTVYVIVIS